MVSRIHIFLFHFTVAPLCYLYDEPESLYFTFRCLYTRYWYRLHEISSHENGIVALCLLFEKLLHRHETQLWFHLRALRVLPYVTYLFRLTDVYDVCIYVCMCICSIKIYKIWYRKRYVFYILYAGRYSMHSMYLCILFSPLSL